MNQLSLLIYLAGVTNSLGNFFTFVTVMLGVLAGGFIIIWVLLFCETDRNGDLLQGDALARRREIRPKICRWAWGVTSMFMLVGTMAMLIPNRQSVLLIAASELGEKVLNHPRVQTVVDPSIALLTAWMEKETQMIRNQMDGKIDPGSKTR